MAKQRGVATEPLTIRLESDVVAVFRELAAQRTLDAAGAVSVTAQDVMREWLHEHPACKRRAIGEEKPVRAKSGSRRMR